MENIFSLQKEGLAVGIRHAYTAFSKNENTNETLNFILSNLK